MIGSSETCRVFAVAAIVVIAACSSSSSGTTVKPPDAGGHDAGGHDAAEHHDAGGHREAGDDAASCAAAPKCTGKLSGGVNATLSTCTLSSEQGLASGFGEVTFSFAAEGGASAGSISGTGNISTTGKFKVATYTPSSGLWNDTGTTGVAADSLWTVSWSPNASTTVMAECNGIKSPDEIDSLCAPTTLDITSIDSCDDIHGTLDLTLPAYAGPPATPAVSIQLAF